MPSTSAPVKGRLVVGAVAGLFTPGVAEVGDAVAGSWLVGLAELPETVGGACEQLLPDIDPHPVPVAPATDGTAINDATARPEPINKRLAHIIGCPSSRRGA
jgi:hypothetical protein